MVREFETGAVRDLDENKLDYEGFLSPIVLKRYAEYMHANRKLPDGSMRASDNWQLGIPKDAFMKSLFRHFMEVWTAHREGTIDENALCAVMFNTMGYLHEVLKASNQQAEAINRLTNHIPDSPSLAWKAIVPERGCLFDLPDEPEVPF